ncbi:LppX_LprAFG lipoprotein [Sphaerisporangium aureirubrum]|uniref:LppX_LprAFG lipoprotein n=1 Tax=Sphaerisporangium aureirubrum TaxID=1544736 RepID=A0ABW1NBW3_9ACTN
MKRRTTFAVVAAGAAMLIAVSACGQAAQSPAQPLGSVKLSAAETLQQSAKSAEAVSSYAAQIAVDFTSPKDGAGSVKGSMVYHQKPQVASDVTLDQISAGGQNVPGGVRVILIGQTAYMKVEMLTKLLGGTKPWIKLDLAELGRSTGVDAGQFLAQAQQLDLQSSVKMITGSKDVKAVGTETVGGVDTTHYKGTFPVAEAVKQLSPELRQKIEPQLSKLKNMKFDAWIDGENLPRKLQMNGAAEGGTFKATMQFTSFNQAAEVTAPPADQVGELPKGLGDAGGTGTIGG